METTQRVFSRADMLLSYRDFQVRFWKAHFVEKEKALGTFDLGFLVGEILFRVRLGDNESLSEYVRGISGAAGMMLDIDSYLPTASLAHHPAWTIGGLRQIVLAVLHRRFGTSPIYQPYGLRAKDEVQ